MRGGAARQRPQVRYGCLLPCEEPRFRRLVVPRCATPNDVQCWGLAWSKEASLLELEQEDVA